MHFLSTHLIINQVGFKENVLVFQTKFMMRGDVEGLLRSGSNLIGTFTRQQLELIVRYAYFVYFC